MGHDAAGTPAACPPAGGLPRGGITCPDVESSVWERFVDGENESVSPVEARSACIVCAALRLIPCVLGGWWSVRAESKHNKVEVQHKQSGVAGF